MQPARLELCSLPLMHPPAPHDGEESLPGFQHCVDLREEGTVGTHLGRHFAGASVLGRAGQWSRRATCAPRLVPLETVFMTCTPSTSKRALGKRESERLWSRSGGLTLDRLEVLASKKKGWQGCGSYRVTFVIQISQGTV